MSSCCKKSNSKSVWWWDINDWTEVRQTLCVWALNILVYTVYRFIFYNQSSSAITLCRAFIYNIEYIEYSTGTESAPSDQLSNCVTSESNLWPQIFVVPLNKHLQNLDLLSPSRSSFILLLILGQRSCFPRRPAWSTAESSHWPAAWTAHQTPPPAPIKSKEALCTITIISIIMIIL